MIKILSWNVLSEDFVKQNNNYSTLDRYKSICRYLFEDDIYSLIGIQECTMDLYKYIEKYISDKFNNYKLYFGSTDYNNSFIFGEPSEEWYNKSNKYGNLCIFNTDRVKNISSYFSPFEGTSNHNNAIINVLEVDNKQVVWVNTHLSLNRIENKLQVSSILDNIEYLNTNGLIDNYNNIIFSGDFNNKNVLKNINNSSFELYPSINTESNTFCYENYNYDNIYHSKSLLLTNFKIIYDMECCYPYPVLDVNCDSGISDHIPVVAELSLTNKICDTDLQFFSKTTGKSYYYNTKTNKSSWKNRKNSHTDTINLKSDWIVLPSSKNKYIYFYNLKTGISQWNIP